MERTNVYARRRPPRQRLGAMAASCIEIDRACGSRLVGRYPGWQYNPTAFPGACFRAPSGWMNEVDACGVDCLTVAGAAQAASARFRRGRSLLLPVEPRRVNHAAGTNGQDFRASAGAVSQKLRRSLFGGKLQSPTMPASSPIDQIAERVERLLVRHEEVQRTNALLQEQVEALTRERDALKSRLAAARTRLDALLERLPAEPPSEDSPA